MTANAQLLSDSRHQALALENAVNGALLGQSRAVRLILVSVFARGHVLLEGDVGVGKTTMLRCIARAIGGAYSRIEGTVDLMPSDLVYYTYITEDGQPRVAPGPLLRHGEALSVFFFNEVNRARPQLHSLLLRVMAERSVAAFNRDHPLPFLQVFADRNRVEKEETFELPAAARDRFAMEILIERPQERDLQRQLMFDTRFHDADALVDTVPAGVVPHERLGAIAGAIQHHVSGTERLQEYALDLCMATADPHAYGVRLSDVDVAELIEAGVSPRGSSMLLRAARVHAWLEGRDQMLPEDLRFVFYESIAHRVFFKPVYELQRAALIQPFVASLLDRVAAP
ncbi:MAG: MoxR family ATPase [Pseudomonadota bacterium]